MDITITALRPDDRQEWQRLYCAYADFYQVPMTREILERVWQWIFDPDNAFFALISRDEQGRGVGLMHYREMPSPLRGVGVGFLDDLYIDPDYRGSGTAERMFERLRQEAQARNWPLVRWITAENNYRARAVYDRLATKTHWQTYQMDCG